MNAIQITPLHERLESTCVVPGSKSYTNRALVMAALTKGVTEIVAPLESDDTAAMIDCLRSLQIPVEMINGTIQVGTTSAKNNETYSCFARDSGTTIRFITALASVLPGTVILRGSKRLEERPIHELINALKQLGATITIPPLTISSHTVHPGVVQMPGDVSSQFFSALLMIAPAIGELTIEVSGNQISKPYIDMTIDMMKQWGVKVENNAYHSYHVAGNQSYNIDHYLVEGDYSSAGYFFALAALTQSTITVKNVNPQSKQADRKFLDILRLMGAEIIDGSNEVTVRGNGVIPLNVDMEACPDQAPTLAVLAAFAQGKTTITGVASLRVKETERVKAVQNELAKMGIRTEADHNTLVIYGGDPHSAVIETYNDHRMAMSFSLAGTCIPGITIHDPQVVNKTFPRYWEVMQSLGISLQNL